jgi:hypothetical protein
MRKLIALLTAVAALVAISSAANAYVRCANPAGCVGVNVQPPYWRGAFPHWRGPTGPAMNYHGMPGTCTVIAGRRQCFNGPGVRISGGNAYTGSWMSSAGPSWRSGSSVGPHCNPGDNLGADGMCHRGGVTGGAASQGTPHCRGNDQLGPDGMCHTNLAGSSVQQASGTGFRIVPPQLNVAPAPVQTVSVPEVPVVPNTAAPQGADVAEYMRQCAAMNGEIRDDGNGMIGCFEKE